MERYQIKQIANEFLDLAFKEHPHYKKLVTDNNFEDFIDKMQGRLHEFRFLAFKHNMKCGASELGRFVCDMVQARTEHLIKKHR